MRIPKSIVLVDDDRDDQEIFKSACAVIDSAAQVVSFENGEQALNDLLLMSSRPDIIFLDLNMPRFNGIELLQKLKQSSSLKSIPVVIYSTSFDRAVEVACTGMGAVEVMEKPNSFKVLCSKLETVFQSVFSSPLAY